MSSSPVGGPTPDIPPTQDSHDALPSGTRLGEFEIRAVLGVGGFGIVYLAFDHALERQVAIKEYLPGAFAGRGRDAQVSLRSSSHAQTFGVGLRSFINEARLLARFDHPALLKVYRFWEANGTAYMAMPYYQGATLRAARRAMPAVPSQQWLEDVLEPLLGAIEVLHREQVFHRDIAPDNIILRDNGGPVLLDFGAARQVIGDRTQSLTAILKPNFAPIEQYSENTQLRQGPWSDLYALGAVVHFCVTGRPPMPSAARAVHDELPMLADAARVLGASYSPAFLRAWQATLAVRPSERPQNVQQLRRMLSQEVAPDAQPVAAAKDDGWATTQVLDPAASPGPAAGAAVASGAAGAASAASTRPASDPARPSPRAAPKAGGPRRAVLAAIGAALVVVLAAVGLRIGHRAGAVPVADAAAPTTASAPSTAPATSAATTQAANLHAPGSASDPAGGPLNSTAATGATAAAAALQGASASDISKGVPLAASATEAQVARRARGDARSRTAREVDPAQAAKAGRAVATPATDAGMDSTRAGATSVQPAPAETAAQAAPRSPREACGRRVLMALYLCMQRECEQPQFSGHPQCKRLHEQYQRREPQDLQ